MYFVIVSDMIFRFFRFFYVLKKEISNNFDKRQPRVSCQYSNILGKKKHQCPKRAPPDHHVTGAVTGPHDSSTNLVPEVNFSPLAIAPSPSHSGAQPRKMQFIWKKMQNELHLPELLHNFLTKCILCQAGRWWWWLREGWSYFCVSSVAGRGKIEKRPAKCTVMCHWSRVRAFRGGVFHKTRDHLPAPPPTPQGPRHLSTSLENWVCVCLWESCWQLPTWPYNYTSLPVEREICQGAKWEEIFFSHKSVVPMQHHTAFYVGAWVWITLKDYLTSHSLENCYRNRSEIEQ